MGKKKGGVWGGGGSSLRLSRSGINRDNYGPMSATLPRAPDKVNKAP